jgi:diguanylate cyclase (GGDEF)-like protein/PAS domain S-box-containing protein
MQFTFLRDMDPLTLEERNPATRRGASNWRPALADQVGEVIGVMPAIAVASLVFAAIIFASLPQGGIGLAQASWLAAVVSANLAGLLLWYVARRMNASEIRDRSFSLALAVIAAVMGMTTGLMPSMFLPGSDELLRTEVLLATAVSMSSAGLMLAVMPRVATAFALPAILGVAGASLALPDPRWVWIVAILLLAWVGVMVFVSRRQAYNLAARRRLHGLFKHQRETIALLLKEFEESESDWLWETDSDGAIKGVSARFRQAAGKATAIEGAGFTEMLRSMAGDDEFPILRIETAITGREMFRDVEIRLMIDSVERWWRLTGKPMFEDDGGYRGYIGVASDITAQKLSERKIHFLAHNDPLTGLLNRTKFTESLNQCVTRLERYGTPFAVLYLDLDQFKLVNDSRGHLVGDQLLMQVSKRLTSVLRDTDIIARVGGDEFAVLLPEECGNQQLKALAERLIQTVSAPYDIDGESAKIGLSIGVAIAPNNGTRANQILRNADLALYRAKEEGRATYRFFDTRMDADNRERRMLENELRQAIEGRELELHFQPLVGAENKKPIGFEALLRWNHPIRGIVPPAEFIPIAEQSGIICEIGDWTIREACRVAATWPNELMVAVNMSAKHFQSSDIVTVVRDALRDSGLPASRLEIEITESLLIKNQDEVRDRLMQLKQLGTTIALDDFGTGYSSLSYLLKFPFDKIKIDKSFITASSEDDVARDILRSIAALGSTLQMSVTAEGVETPEQVEFLREIACSSLQGYFFAKPLNPSNLAAYLIQSFAAENSGTTGGEKPRIRLAS